MDESSRNFLHVNAFFLKRKLSKKDYRIDCYIFKLSHFYSSTLDHKKVLNYIIKTYQRGHKLYPLNSALCRDEGIF